MLSTIFVGAVRMFLLVILLIIGISFTLLLLRGLLNLIGFFYHFLTMGQL